MVRNLEKTKYISQGLILIFAGSDSDKGHIEKLQGEIAKANKSGEFVLGHQVLNDLSGCNFDHF